MCGSQATLYSWRCSVFNIYRKHQYIPWLLITCQVGCTPKNDSTMHTSGCFSKWLFTAIVGQQWLSYIGIGYRKGIPVSFLVIQWTLGVGLSHSQPWNVRVWSQTLGGIYMYRYICIYIHNIIGRNPISNVDKTINYINFQHHISIYIYIQIRI